MDGESDMFPAPVKDPPTTKVYTVRPFFPDDQVRFCVTIGLFHRLRAGPD